MATSRTVTELIQASLRVLGVLAAGETVNANDTGTGLSVLQDMISEWTDITVPYISEDTITLVNAQGSYTIGESGSPDKNTVRPITIEGAFVRDSGNYDHPVRIISEADYNRFTSKTTSGRPDRLYYKPTSPNGTIYLWPVPTSAETLYVTGRKPLIDPAALVDDIFATTQIPRNYHSAIKWNLAVELAPEYGVQLDQVILGRAVQSYNRILSTNMGQAVAPVSIEVTRAVNSERYSVLQN